jgi:uncharacterized protein
MCQGLANSIVGFAGAEYVGQAPTAQTWLYALAAFARAVVGTSVGSRWVSQTMTCYTLATLLEVGGIQLISFRPESIRL